MASTITMDFDYLFFDKLVEFRFDCMTSSIIAFIDGKDVMSICMFSGNIEKFFMNKMYDNYRDEVLSKFRLRFDPCNGEGFKRELDKVEKAFKDYQVKTTQEMAKQKAIIDHLSTLLKGEK